MRKTAAGTRQASKKPSNREKKLEVRRTLGFGQRQVKRCDNSFESMAHSKTRVAAFQGALGYGGWVLSIVEVITKGGDSTSSHVSQAASGHFWITMPSWGPGKKEKTAVLARLTRERGTPIVPVSKSTEQPDLVDASIDKNRNKNARALRHGPPAWLDWPRRYVGPLNKGVAPAAQE